MLVEERKAVDAVEEVVELAEQFLVEAALAAGLCEESEDDAGEELVAPAEAKVAREVGLEGEEEAGCTRLDDDVVVYQYVAELRSRLGLR